VTLRRYAPMKPSRGTTWPAEVRAEIEARDPFCVGALIPGFGESECYGQPELDHVRASHGTGMKSASVASNGVRLCAWHHRWKTEHGREARPLLLAYLSSKGAR
jgi:hypothetical protein